MISISCRRMMVESSPSFCKLFADAVFLGGSRSHDSRRRDATPLLPSPHLGRWRGRGINRVRAQGLLDHDTRRPSSTPEFDRCCESAVAGFTELCTRNLVRRRRRCSPSRCCKSHVEIKVAQFAGGGGERASLAPLSASVPARLLGRRLGGNGGRDAAAQAEGKNKNEPVSRLSS